jgi:hypothetical protein
LLNALPDDCRDGRLTERLDRLLLLELRLTERLGLRELELFAELAELDRPDELLLLAPPPFFLANAPSSATNPKKKAATINIRSKRR